MPNVLKVGVFGLPGSGKTTLLRTLKATANKGQHVHVLATEAGFSALGGVDAEGRPIFEGRIQQVVDIRELEDELTWIAGVYGIAKPNEAFGAQRYAEVVAAKGGTFLDAYKGVYPTIAIDSLTDISRRVFQRSERSDETLSKKTGARDVFAVHGKAKSEVEWMLGVLIDLYPGEIVLLGIADFAEDPINGRTYFLKSDTKKASGTIVEKLEAVLFLGVGHDEDAGDFRYLRCRACTDGRPGSGLPIKDRTGTLNEVEPPNLSVIRQKFRDGRRVVELQTDLPPSLR